MADNTINVKIKQRIDTADNWSSKNPVLLAGEIGYIKGTAQYRVGDGTNNWSDLPLYQGMTSSDKNKLDGIASGANNYSHPTTSGNKHIPSGGSSGQILRWSADGTAVWGADNNTWRPVETTLTNENLNNITSPGFYNAGGGNTVTNKPSGVEHFGMIIVHRASGSYYTQILFNDTKSWRRFCVNGTWGSWVEEKLTDTVYTHPSYTAKSSGLYKVTVDATGHVSATTEVSKGDITNLGIPSTNTTYSNFVKSGSGAKAGLVPAPSTTAGATKYLREDGTWAVPPDNNTTYNNMTAATASAAGKAGLVPAPAAGKQASFLRGDGTWVVPTNTTYSDATTSTHGLMTAAMVTKLNGIATNANNYSLPTASSSTLGGVKTTSTVTSTSGYTACPIISGVVYYKDTNTTYPAATSSANGLMTSTAYSALDTELTEADVNAIFA